MENNPIYLEIIKPHKEKGHYSKRSYRLSLISALCFALFIVSGSFIAESRNQSWLIIPFYFTFLVFVYSSLVCLITGIRSIRNKENKYILRRNIAIGYSAIIIVLLIMSVLVNYLI